MDTLTHYLISWLIGNKINLKIDYFRAFLLGSIIPDIDALTILFGYSYFNALHATITHSVFTGIIFAIIIALSLKKFYPWSGDPGNMFRFGYAGFFIS